MDIQFIDLYQECRLTPDNTPNDGPRVNLYYLLVPGSQQTVGFRSSFRILPQNTTPDYDPQTGTYADENFAEHYASALQALTRPACNACPANLLCKPKIRAVGHTVEFSHQRYTLATNSIAAKLLRGIRRI